MEGYTLDYCKRTYPNLYRAMLGMCDKMDDNEVGTIVGEPDGRIKVGVKRSKSNNSLTILVNDEVVIKAYFDADSANNEVGFGVKTKVFKEYKDYIAFDLQRKLRCEWKKRSA